MHHIADRYKYAAFELLLAHGTADGYPVTVTQSPAGDASGFCQLDATDAGLQELIRVVAKGDCDESLLLNLGDRLFSGLFIPPIASLYHSSLNIVRAQGKGLRVRLCVEPPALAALHGNTCTTLWRMHSLLFRRKPLWCATCPSTCPFTPPVSMFRCAYWPS